MGSWASNGNELPRGLQGLGMSIYKIEMISYLFYVFPCWKYSDNKRIPKHILGVVIFEFCPDKSPCWSKPSEAVVENSMPFKHISPLATDVRLRYVHYSACSSG